MHSMKPTVPNLSQTTWTALFWTKFEDRLLSGMHPVGPRHWHHGGDRGGAPPPLCSYDPRQGRSASDGTTTFLHARPKCPGRSPSLWGTSNNDDFVVGSPAAVA